MRWYEKLSLEHSEPFMDYVDLEEYLMRFSSPIIEAYKCLIIGGKKWDYLEVEQTKMM